MAQFTRTARVGAAVLLLSAVSVARAAVSLVGIGTIAGTALDKSGLTGDILNSAGNAPSNVPGVPNNAFGGAGSGIGYTGSNNLYIMTPDRGPADGNSQYADRVQYVQILVDANAGTVTPTNTATTLLTNGGQPLTGNSAAFGGTNLRFDPEAVRVSGTGDGSYWISDEYGPYVRKFNSSGQQIAAFAVPAKYGISTPNADANTELSPLNNPIGRQTNRGMEGLAISPSGNTLFGLMQNALIQDHAYSTPQGITRASTNTRILQMDLTNNTTKEFVYQINAANNGIGVNEILAVDDHRFLVLERDNRVGIAGRLASIYLIDTTNATDVNLDAAFTGTTANNGLPQTGLPAGVNPVFKYSTPLINLEAMIPGAQLPEKIEGLSWGPDFANGDKLLIVTTDNDFITANPNYFYAFRVPQASLVPEPASLGVLAIGALALMRRRR